MRVVLGPMEGVLDHLMRQILTEINDYDLCVTEFVRVIDQLLPDHVFHRLCPELLQGSQTASGVPVHVQLLGQEPNWMAENAIKAASLGARGIDINFGCPAKMVNKSKGGAALLQHPELIHRVVKACREAVPETIPVTAKIRLGWENPEDCFEIVDAIQSAGANELTVHARTKQGGYKASEIKWDYINQIRERFDILDEIYPESTEEELDALWEEIESGEADLDQILSDAWDNNVDIDWDRQYDDWWTDRKGGYDVTYGLWNE